MYFMAFFFFFLVSQGLYFLFSGFMTMLNRDIVIGEYEKAG